MGSGSSKMSCKMYTRPDAPVLWYKLDSEQSIKWHDEPTGFGQYRDKSYREGCTPDVSVNRPGNEKGELGGRIVFLSKANRKTNYAQLSLSPKYDLGPGSKIFAKVFLSVPLDTMPIGENNLYYKKHDPADDAVNYKGFGPVLLAPVIRAIALFVSVDDVPQSDQIFCSDDDDPTLDNSEGDKPDDASTVTSAISGSFVTYTVSQSHTRFFFLHVPILATHSDCTKGSNGPTAIVISKAFLRLFSKLSPGTHTIDILTQVYYNHSKYRYFVRDHNLNAQGVWRDGLPNDFLKSPHPDPYELVTPENYLAEGSFTVNIPANFDTIFDGMMDRKPPTERYHDDDLENIRKEAGLVAMGKFVKEFGMTGLPDITIITSKSKETIAQKEKKTDYRHSYEYVEFSTCWLESGDSSPSGIGTMFEGAMAKGEVIPKEYSQTWTWHTVTREGKPHETIPLNVKNKYILAKMVERRRSQTTLIERLKPGLKRLSMAMNS